MRPIRALGLFVAGFHAGVLGAATVMKRALPSRGEPASDEVRLVAIFDGVTLKSTATGFRGGSALAWYGGIQLDLRDAALAPGARLSLHALYGGIEIKVPSDWKVHSTLRSFAGGAEVGALEPAEPDAPTLSVDGFAAFGGIAVGASAGSASDGS